MGNIYVITGSTSGIGQKLVETFAAQGATVFAGYRNKEKLPANPPENIIYFYINMTDKKSIIDVANFIKSKTNKIDTLINVAGCVEAGPIEKIDTDRLRRQFDVNVFSHIELTQQLIDLLDNGKIINVSSMASYGLFPFISPYCASKRAMDIFFNAFDIENHRNIKVVSLKLGVISTPIWEKSVSANMEYFNECTGYERELEFLKDNALKNTSLGIPVERVANFIEKIVKKKNPKSSYTYGADAKFAQILSLLPQDIINKIIKFGIRHRINC